MSQEMLFKDIAVIGEDFALSQNANVWVKEGRICYVGGETPPEAAGATVYHGAGKLLAPGFYNIHGHLPMTLMRGFGEGLPLHRWLSERMFPFEEKLSREDCHWGALLGMAEMLASGAVSFTDMYFNEDVILQAAHHVGMKANLSQGVTPGLGSACRYTEEEAYEVTLALLKQAAGLGHGRVKIDASIHAEYTSDGPIVADVAAFAKERGLSIHLHLSETKKEHEECKVRRGMTPAQWFFKNGVFEVPVTAAHCVWIEGEDYEILKAGGATVAHNPSSNLKLSSGIAPIKAMLQNGLQVGIGTDGAASNNNLNLLEEIALASLLAKGASGDPLLLGPSEALRLACKNGALAQGRGDCGEIKAGNRADLAVYNFDSPHLCPAFDMAANLLYSAQAADVALTMVDGEVLYKEGEYLTIDIEKTKYQAAAAARRIGAELGF